MFSRHNNSLECKVSFYLYSINFSVNENVNLKPLGAALDGINLRKKRREAMMGINTPGMDIGFVQIYFLALALIAWRRSMANIRMWSLALSFRSMVS